MRLLFLCKRRPMGKDLLESPYGRFYYLPRLLAERGHDVSVLLLDYKNGPPIDVERAGVRWLSSGPIKYNGTIRKAVASLCPDWIVGFSDTYFGILAVHHAGRSGALACVDAYDNYESYLAWCKPLHWLWRRALRRADLITAAGPGLVELMSSGKPGCVTAIVPMAADPVGFQATNQRECRETLSIPSSGTYVGYCGSLHRSRGVETLFAAIDLLRQNRPEIQFYHSGRTWSDVSIPDNLRSLGYLPDDHVPVLLNSMNTLVVVNRPSRFGHHSYPVKLYEAMACDVPVVATSTLATDWILRDYPERLVPPNDPEALAQAILRSLDDEPPRYRRPAGWESPCDTFEAALQSKHGAGIPNPNRFTVPN